MNISFFFGALLLVDGVFGDDVKVSVMEGDSVTLKPHTVIPEDASADWWFGDKRIAKKETAGLFSTSEGHDVGFKDRLNVDTQTGSLTITNIRTKDTGDYKLHISGKNETIEIFSVIVTDAVKSLSVMVGDNVTLHTGVTGIQRDDLIQWKSGEQVLNGDLAIRNIQSHQSGDYELEINTSSMILHRKLRINISGNMTTVSVKEGESITLDTGLVEIKGYDLIMWKFENQLIAEINTVTNKFLKYDTSDETFNGRLQRHSQTGPLIISNSRISDSGDYHLNMISSTHTVQRTINVTVSGVFAVDVKVSLSVMEGDSVTLKPHTEIPEDDSAEWWFGDDIIAIKETGGFSTSDGDNVGFKDRLNVDKQNGSLTITNIRTKDTGDYKLQIRSRTETKDEIFSVTVRDAVESVLVTEGETVTLHTGVTGIQRDDQIQWKFGGVPIADLNGADARWSNTDDTGELTIRNIQRNQYGDYEVEIKNKNSLIFHKKFRITAIDHSKWMWIGIVIGVVIGIVIGIVIGTKFCPCRKKT